MPTILATVCRATGIGFAAIARVTDERWIACRVLAAGHAIYGRQFNPQITLKAFAYLGDGNLENVLSTARAALIKAIGETDPLRLPAIASSNAQSVGKARATNVMSVESTTDQPRNDCDRPEADMVRETPAIVGRSHPVSWLTP